MGAVPVALLVGFAAPGDLAVAWARELVAGIAAECARAGATVVGGDVSSAGSVVLAATALGDLAGRDPVTRAGARPGDVLAYAGALGESVAGLTYDAVASKIRSQVPDLLTRHKAKNVEFKVVIKGVKALLKAVPH